MDLWISNACFRNGLPPCWAPSKLSTPNLPYPNPVLSQRVRPDLQSRHSFTMFEETKRAPAQQQDVIRPSKSRPTITARSKSYFPSATELPTSSPSSVSSHGNAPTLDEIEKNVP